MFSLFNDTSMPGCQNCSGDGEFALDPTTNESCTQCNLTCEPGYEGVACPTQPGWLLCQECGAPPANASLNGLLCDWDCDAGYFRLNSSYCEPCAGGQCQAGFNRSQCTPIRDSDCDTPCVDPRKPKYNSIWTEGCQWACAPGYTQSTQNYVLWVQYSCVPTTSRVFWLYG